jgi:hypothetical protein
MMGHHAWLLFNRDDGFNLATDEAYISDHGEHFHTSDPDDDD